jgi:hypothetical protein
VSDELDNERRLCIMEDQKLGTLVPYHTISYHRTNAAIKTNETVVLSKSL